VTARRPERVPRWLEETVYEFASGVALAVGVVGVVRAGRDVWLGVVLLVLAFVFNARAAALRRTRRATPPAGDATGLAGDRLLPREHVEAAPDDEEPEQEATRQGRNDGPYA
jgi:hypothetical protein